MSVNECPKFLEKKYCVLMTVPTRAYPVPGNCASCPHTANHYDAMHAIKVQGKQHGRSCAEL
jgi:hypothetical protein